MHHVLCVCACVCVHVVCPRACTACFCMCKSPCVYVCLCVCVPVCVCVHLCACLCVCCQWLAGICGLFTPDVRSCVSAACDLVLVRVRRKSAQRLLPLLLVLTRTRLLPSSPSAHKASVPRFGGRGSLQQRWEEEGDKGSNRKVTRVRIRTPVMTFGTL